MAYSYKKRAALNQKKSHDLRTSCPKRARRASRARCAHWNEALTATNTINTMFGVNVSPAAANTS